VPPPSGRLSQREGTATATRKGNLDNIRGSWTALVAAACVGIILLLGLGSERVRRVVREALPESLGGTQKRAENLYGPPKEKEEEKPKEKDPNALPDVPAQDSVRGIVRDSKGQPIPGATVSVERWRRSVWEVLSTAKANKEGEFVAGPVARAQLSAVARAEGFASQRKTVRTGARLEFSLKSGGVFAGKVVDALTGEPVKDCYLSGWSQRGDWWETGRTDEKGMFRFGSVPPGRLWIQVRPAEYRAVNLSDVEVNEGKETFKEIPVVRGGKLKGKVVDVETKMPVAHAKIRTWDGAKSAESGEDGKYEIPSPDQGGMSFKVSAPEYPEQWTWVQLSGDPSADFERDMEIGKGGKVSGVVMKPDGSPAAGARVGRDPGELLTGVPEQTATADAEGAFTLEAVPAMRRGVLFAVADGFALTKSDPLELRAGTEISGIRITLITGAAFKGTVKDEDGEPLAAVSFSVQKEWNWQDWQRMQEEGGWFWIPEMVGYSLADGTWEVAGVPPGNYQMRVNLEGYAPESRSRLAAPAQGEIAGLDFVLRKGGSITGRVRNQAGEPLQGVSVTAWGVVVGSEGNMEWVQRAEVRTDADGLFLMDGLRDGTYQLNFQCTGLAQQILQGISTGTRELPVTMLPNARLEGRVVDTDGTTPVPAFKVRMYMEIDARGNRSGPGNMQREQEFADREGKFVLQDVPEGLWAIVAVSGNKVSARFGGIVVVAGATVSDLRLILSVGGRLKVTVRDSVGTALQGAGISAGRSMPDGSFQNEFWGQTDAEGTVSFAAMPDGTWVLYGDHQGRVRQSRTVNIGGGVDAEVEMTLRAGGSILVHASDGKGAPVAGADVTFQEGATGTILQPDWGRIWQKAYEKSGGTGRVDWQKVMEEATKTSAQGLLLRETLPPGTVTVTLRKQGLKEWKGTAQVLEGFEIDCHGTLEPLPDPAAPGNPARPGSDGSDEEVLVDEEE